MNRHFLSALWAEFVGTLLLLAIVVGSGIMGENLAQGNSAVALLANSIATGAGLVVLITMLGPVSGAHFNPLVTAVQILRREMATKHGLLYILVQGWGAVLGVWLIHFIFDVPVWQLSEKSRTGWSQWGSEVLASAGLILVILQTLRVRADFVPTAVGLYITAAYWFTSSTSFANPAVTLARSFTNTFAGIAPADVAAFVCAQILGAGLGWVSYQLLSISKRP